MTTQEDLKENQVLIYTPEGEDNLVMAAPKDPLKKFNSELVRLEAEAQWENLDGAVRVTVRSGANTFSGNGEDIHKAAANVLVLMEAIKQ